ncbi:hypothetical protein [Nocardia ninae]|nr:hypothetical protein [Nocardia ninae]
MMTITVRERAIRRTPAREARATGRYAIGAAKGHARGSGTAAGGTECPD